MGRSLSNSLECSYSPLNPHEPGTTVHTSLSMLVFHVPPRVTIKQRLQHSLPHISKPFRVPPTNQFQRLTNHPVRFDLSTSHISVTHAL